MLIARLGKVALGSLRAFPQDGCTGAHGQWHRHETLWHVHLHVPNAHDTTRIGSWLIDGSVAIERFKDVVGIEQTLPEEKAGTYHTEARFAMSLLERIPQTGDRFQWNGLSHRSRRGAGPPARGGQSSQDVGVQPYAIRIALALWRPVQWLSRSPCPRDCGPCRFLVHRIEDCFHPNFRKCDNRTPNAKSYE